MNKSLLCKECPHRKKHEGGTIKHNQLLKCWQHDCHITGKDCQGLKRDLLQYHTGEAYQYGGKEITAGTFKMIDGVQVRSDKTRHEHEQE